MSVEPLDLELPPEPGQLARFRATLGDWLDRAGVNGHDRDELILAAHEADANGVEHSNEGGTVRVRVETDDQAVTVTSPGQWREPETRLGRGHGLLIIRGLTEIDIDATAVSADVRMRRRLSTLE